jgi:hypothetical protein
LLRYQYNNVLSTSRQGPAFTTTFAVVYKPIWCMSLKGQDDGGATRRQRREDEYQEWYQRPPKIHADQLVLRRLERLTPVGRREFREELMGVIHATRTVFLLENEAMTYHAPRAQHTFAPKHSDTFTPATTRLHSGSGRRQAGPQQLRMESGTTPRTPYARHAQAFDAPYTPTGLKNDGTAFINSREQSQQYIRPPEAMLAMPSARPYGNKHI